MHNRITNLVEPDHTNGHAPPDTLSPDQLDALLQDYCRGDLTLPDLAANHGLSITKLLDILDHPRIAATLDRLAEHARLQARRLAALAQPVAIDRLRRLTTSDPGDHRLLPPAVEARTRETTRKAAAHIARLAAARPASDPKPPKAPAKAPTQPDGAPRASGGATPANPAPRTNHTPPMRNAPDRSGAHANHQPPTPAEPTPPATALSPPLHRASGRKTHS